jgi:hypothetical protein
MVPCDKARVQIMLSVHCRPSYKLQCINSASVAYLALCIAKVNNRPLDLVKRYAFLVAILCPTLERTVSSGSAGSAVEK